MRGALYDTEWDELWDEHARSVPVAADAEPQMGVAQAVTPRVHRWAVLALAVLLVPISAPLLSEDGGSRGIPREALFSFSPAEVLLPPVDAALARLAAESVSAHCWVQQLRPQGPSCAEPATAR